MAKGRDGESEWSLLPLNLPPRRTNQSNRYPGLCKWHKNPEQTQAQQILLTTPSTPGTAPGDSPSPLSQSRLPRDCGKHQDKGDWAASLLVWPWPSWK